MNVEVIPLYLYLYFILSYSPSFLFKFSIVKVIPLYFYLDLINIELSPFIIIPSPTKLRWDIVLLPSDLPSFGEHSRINILQWILTKRGTYLVLKRIWNPIDSQGQRSRSPGQIFYSIVSLWTLESTSFNGFWPSLVHT